MAKEITVHIFISRHGEPEVPWNSLTPEEKQEARQRLAANMAKGIEDAYRQSPELW